MIEGTEHTQRYPFLSKHHFSWHNSVTKHFQFHIFKRLNKYKTWTKAIWHVFYFSKIHCNKHNKIKFKFLLKIMKLETKVICFMQISISILKKSLEKRSALSIQSGRPQKNCSPQNICIHFKSHQERLKFLGEPYGFLNSHLEQDLLSSKSYSRTLYLCVEQLNKGKNISLSPRKHKK